MDVSLRGRVSLILFSVKFPQITFNPSVFSGIFLGTFSQLGLDRLEEGAGN